MHKGASPASAQQAEEDPCSSSSDDETTRLLPAPSAAGAAARNASGSMQRIASRASQQTVPPAQQECSAACTAQDGEEPRACRICFESHSGPDDPLISPCKCAGSSQYIHRQCLRKWRESALQNPRSLAYYRCEVCHFEYKFMRSDLASVLAHPASVAAVFVLLLLVLTTLLGYIPLVQSLLRTAGADASWHAPESAWGWLLLHVINGLLLVGWAGALFWMVAVCSGRSSASNCYCPGIYMCPDCTGLMAGGEVCGPIVAVLLLAAAVIGLLGVLPYAYAWLYREVRRVSEATVRMVENVGHRSAAEQPSSATASAV